jgi:hypothetical protein
MNTTSNHTYGAVGVLNYYLRIMGHQSPPRWEKEVIAPMGCVKSVARIALAELSFRISFASRDMFRLAHMADKINHITHLSNHKPIQNALIAQHSIWILVDALESLLNHPIDAESMEYMSRYISNACNCLRGHIRNRRKLAINNPTSMLSFSAMLDLSVTVVPQRHLVHSR